MKYLTFFLFLTICSLSYSQEINYTIEKYNCIDCPKSKTLKFKNTEGLRYELYCLPGNINRLFPQYVKIHPEDNSSIELKLLLKSDILEGFLNDYSYFYMKKYYKTYSNSFEKASVYGIENAINLVEDIVYTEFDNMLKEYDENEIKFLVTGKNESKIIRKTNKLRQRYLNERSKLKSEIEKQIKIKLKQEAK